MAKRTPRQGPFDDYVEWTEHRYDPGYFLGGRLPPHLRKTALGPKGRRLAGVLLGVAAVATLATALGAVGSVRPGEWPLYGLFYGALFLLTSVAAVKMYRSGKGTTQKGGPSQPNPEA
jgi:hypothetical protein